MLNQVMTTNLNHIDWQEILVFLQTHTHSQLAKQRQANITPLATPELAQQSFREIQEAREYLKFHGNRPRLESIDELDSIKLRIEKNAQLEVKDLVCLRHFLFDQASLLRALSDMDSQWAQNHIAQLSDPRSSLAYIEQLITVSGEFRSDASEALYQAFQEKKALKSNIHNLLNRLVKQNELDGVLQDRFVTTRDGRWVIPVKSGMQSRFEGIIHDSSASKQTVFMEPQEVVKSNNRIKELDMEIQREIDRLLRQISDYFYQNHAALLRDFLLLVDLDMLFARAKLSLQIGARPIVFSEDCIDLKQMSNPVLEIQKKPGQNIVRNDLYLDADKMALVLSGPNAGGKTILLKSLGLVAQMARCGLPPAVGEDSQIPFFHKLWISVGDAQNITEGLSTFAGHMQELNKAAMEAGPDSLILVDEICGSTDPEEGSALAKAFINAFCDKKAFALITSHLGALKQAWQKNNRVEFASMEFDEASGRPLYQLLMGMSGSSYALKTAARVGVLASILEDAIEELSPETKERQKKLQDLDELKKQWTAAHRELAEQKKQANEKKITYEKKLAEWEREKDRLLDRSLREAQERIDAEMEKLRQAKKTVFDVKADLPQIIKNKSESPIQSPEDFNQTFPPGSEVYATNIQKNAIIQSKANSKGEVEILANSMRLSVSYKYLVKRSSQASSRPVGKLQTPARPAHSKAVESIDLRGQMVEEAIARLQEFCDQALVEGTSKIKIIHGHGTGALKKAIRAHLARADFADSWKAGNEQDGGDGVTWVSFR